MGPTITLAGRAASGVESRNPCAVLDAAELAVSRPPVQDILMKQILLDGKPVTGFVLGKYHQILC